MKKLERQTKRLIVRPLRASDYLRWKAYYTTMLPQKNKWDRKNRHLEDVTRPRFNKVLQSQKKLRLEDRLYDLAVFKCSTKEIIGTVAAMDVLRGVGQSAYLGYFISNRFWGRGFGKEAVLAMIDIAFRDIKLH